jgi:hypothetical protein
MAQKELFWAWIGGELLFVRVRRCLVDGLPCDRLGKCVGLACARSRGGVARRGRTVAGTPGKSSARRARSLIVLVLSQPRYLTVAGVGDDI